MESSYKLECNDLQLLFLPNYHVENMEEITSNGVIQLTPVKYFPGVGFIVSGVKPGCKETVQLCNPNVWFNKRKKITFFVEEVIRDENCSVLIDNTRWTHIKVCMCKASEVKFQDLQGIRVRNIMNVEVDSDEKNSIIKVRGIQAGRETLQWSSRKRLLFFDVWERVTITCLNFDGSVNLDKIEEIGNPDVSSDNRIEIYQNRWNKVVSVPNRSCLRVRNMENINSEAVFRLSIDDKGSGPGVYVKPMTAAVGETFEIEWSNEFYMIFSQLPKSWSRMTCIVNSNINEATSPEEDFICESCKLIQRNHSCGGEKLPALSEGSKNFDGPNFSGNPYLKYMTGDGLSCPVNIFNEVERYKRQGLKPKEYMLKVFPSEGYIKSIFCLLDQLLCVVCVDKKSLKQVEHLLELAQEVIQRRMKYMEKAEKLLEAFEKDATKNKDKISKELNSIASHAFAKDAWKIIAKILTDVIKIMHEYPSECLIS